MRITVNLPDDLVLSAKKAARDANTTMNHRCRPAQSIVEAPAKGGSKKV